VNDFDEAGFEDDEQDGSEPESDAGDKRKKKSNNRKKNNRKNQDGEEEPEVVEPEVVEPEPKTPETPVEEGEGSSAGNGEQCTSYTKSSCTNGTCKKSSQKCKKLLGNDRKRRLLELEAVQ